MHIPSKLHQWLLVSSALWSQWTDLVAADCNTYSPAFQLPQLDRQSKHIQRAQQEIEALVRELIDQDPSHDTTSYSVAVTSSKETLFDFHRTAPVRDDSRPGAPVINGSSCYRIASCTKPFTVLALLQQHKAGAIASLDDPINKYISALDDPDQTGKLPWKDITLRTLASQLSGIPRDIGQSDMLVGLRDPISHGLPPLKTPADHHEIICDSFTNYTRACTVSDLLDRLLSSEPLFPPKATATYSNLGFELLGMALENVTSTPYADLVESSVLSPLNLTSTSFSTPPDSVAALPFNNSFYWSYEIGIQKATGGLYSSSDDLAGFARYALTSYNGLSPAVNWFHPVSPSTGLNTFYGMPWEIFRTDQLLDYTARPVTLVTKGGMLPGYWTVLAMVPDYDLGIAILMTGHKGQTTEMLEIVAGKMVEAADRIAQQTLRTKYTGTFSAGAGAPTTDDEPLDSSIALSHSLERGLWVERWTSNATDILAQFDHIFFPGLGGGCTEGYECYLQAVPTLLFKDEQNQQGEIWRLIGHKVATKSEHTGRAGRGRAWLRDSFCLTDLDLGLYGGVSVNEIVFWDELAGGRAEEGWAGGGAGFGSLELSGLRIKLGRDREQDRGGRVVTDRADMPVLTVQEL